jgi:hypothetical protein
MFLFAFSEEFIHMFVGLIMCISNKLNNVKLVERMIMDSKLEVMMVQ